MKNFNFGVLEFKKVFKVFLWTGSAAFLVMIGDWINLVDFPAEYAFIVPIANTIIYALREFVADNR